MQKTVILLAFFAICACYLHAQDPKISTQEWSEQLLEVIDIEEFGEAQYARLLETIDALQLEDTTFSRIRQRFTVRADRCLNERAGYRNATENRRRNSQAYLGDPWHETVRYDIAVKNNHQQVWKMGLVMDKDAGERWAIRPPFADSYSLYAGFEQRRGALRQLLIGHYRIRLGSGLIINQQFSLGKNLQSSHFFSQGPMLSAHSSTSEEGYMQGIAFRYRLNDHWEILPFVSARKIDGQLEHDTLTSWAVDGLHRTQNETEKDNQAWLSHIGLHTRWMGEWYEIGASLLYAHFDKTYYRPKRLYNEHYFRGHQLAQASLDYRLQILGMNLKGELAIDDKAGWALNSALHHNLTDDWKMMLLFRHYSKEYRQLTGAAICESSCMQGETGATFVAEGDITSHLKLEGYADWFRLTTPHYGINQPSQGYELSAKLLWDSRYKKLPYRCSLRYRIKAKYKNNTQTAATNDLTPYYRHYLDGQFQAEPWEMITLKTQVHTRFYSSQYPGGLQAGHAIAQAIGIKVWQLSGEMQATYFDAPDYECRIYATERNLLYGFSLPMLYGTGGRYAATLSWKPAKGLTAELKYALTHYKNATSISSGLQKIDGNRKHDLWMQLRCAF